uniref:Uncharacterized protein n=1 Tax=Amazona collaria TaxID=241587 RepID=A0A8B9FXJ5_9PSIT
RTEKKSPVCIQVFTLYISLSLLVYLFSLRTSLTLVPYFEMPAAPGVHLLVHSHFIQETGDTVEFQYHSSSG